MEISNKNLLLIFDLDETLIHATRDKLNRKADFIFEGFNVYKRPNVDGFLKKCFQNYRVAIWSSADDEYVNEIVKKLIPEHHKLEFVWTRLNCSVKVVKKPILEGFEYGGFYRENQWIKPLRRIKQKDIGMKSMIIIDDSPSKVVENKENALIIKSYEGDESDNELNNLYEFLNNFKGIEDVRSIDKGSWKIKKEDS
ncbi:MAG: NIF family HAD-type phosphatase [Chitinophagales bacterium]